MTGLNTDEMATDRIPWAAMSAAWSIPLALLLGIVAARRPYGKVDGLVTMAGLLGLATPNFWLATLLVLFLAVYLKWFPAIGYVPFTQDPVAALLPHVDHAHWPNMEGRHALAKYRRRAGCRNRRFAK